MNNDLLSVGTQKTLLERLEDEADLCANEGADDIAGLLSEAATELRALAGRVRELEWLDVRWGRVTKAAEHAHGPDAIRFKFSLRKNGTATNTFSKWLDGRWVSFVFAEDDAHIGYIVKELEAERDAATETACGAVRKAFSLGQTYWQQADSEYSSQHRKAEDTWAKFKALVEDTRAALNASKEQP